MREIKTTTGTGIGSRIRERRALLKLKQYQLAKKLGVSATTISQWENEDNKPNGDNILSLAKVLQVNPGWIITGQESHKFVGTPRPVSEFSHVPMFDLQDLTPSFELKNMSLPVKGMRATTMEVSPDAFAVTVEGDALVSTHGSVSLPHGTIVIVEPQREPKSGDLVVATLNKTSGAVLKRYIVDGPNRSLHSLNPLYPPLEMTTRSKVLGVAVRAEYDLA